MFTAPQKTGRDGAGWGVSEPLGEGGQGIRGSRTKATPQVQGQPGIHQALPEMSRLIMSHRTKW